MANRAKTQFFTAASHDLRQPLHAMGLFAEALRQRVHEPEVAQLVNSINESVDALEGLFSELLDITRIDSGGVEVNPESFEVADIFRKLRLHFEPAAFEKGLAPALSRRPPRRRWPIRCWSSASCATSSPTPSATPATARSWSARGAAATRVLLQVWDTGPGIREDERVRVFEEFYQVPGTRQRRAASRRRASASAWPSSGALPG